MKKEIKKGRKKERKIGRKNKRKNKHTSRGPVTKKDQFSKEKNFSSFFWTFFDSELFKSKKRNFENF